MRRLLVLFLSMVVGFVCIPSTGADEIMPDIDYPSSTIKGAETVKLEASFGNVPLYFIPNTGQVDVNARFYAKTPRYTLWMTHEGLIFDSIKKAGGVEVNRLLFLGSHSAPEMAPVGKTGHKVNYFKGKDPSKWRKGIPTSKAVLYRNIYKNIDLKVYGKESEIEYDWIVKPGADPREIKFLYKNVGAAIIDKEGNLVIKTEFGEFTHRKPVSYQSINGKKININSRFVKTGAKSFGFTVGTYDKAHVLVIDPVVTLNYSTYLGGSDNDAGLSIAVGQSGHIHVTGFTESTDFPTEAPYQGTFSVDMNDLFITKFNLDGSGLIFSTYLGGSDFEENGFIAVTNSGDIYVAGSTNSDDFPVTTGDAYNLNGDVFVSLLDGNGNLKESRYLGGTKFEGARDIAVDGSGNAYVVGHTYSTDFPVLNGYQTTFAGDWDMFIIKLDAEGLELLYSTYLGGIRTETSGGIAVDGSGSFYVTGATSSTDFPVKNAYQDELVNEGDWDVFVSKFEPDGSALVYSTYLGGSGDRDWGTGIAVDGAGYAHVTGYTNSTDFPTKNAYQDTYAGGDYDVFITKIGTGGSSLVYSTYLGGSGRDINGGTVDIALDGTGNAYVAGVTGSTDFPVKYAFQDSFQGYSYDAYVSKFNTDGSQLIYSTYLGSSHIEYQCSLAVDSSGNAYVAGQTTGGGFPVHNSYQQYSGGSGDVFVSKLSLSNILTVQSTPDNGVPITVTPVDNKRDGDGNTTFTRGYSPGTVVTLTAPETFNNKIFYRWLRGGNEHFEPGIQLTMDGDYTVEAEYRTPPVISLNRDNLSFGAVASGTATGPQTFLIGNTGETVLNWTTADNAGWLDRSPESGTDSGEVTVSVNAAGLPAGTYTGAVTVSDPRASNSPQTIGVTLAVYNANAAGVPFGSFETPLDGTTVSGSIPVTGWALDDLEVVSVKIFREESATLVYIGDALFVEGARPDVERQYPDSPWNYRAGWGYMMLTNFLPNNGNGTFTLHAVAVDSEGNQVTLGTKTIVCGNANAVKPFGAIDTPTQGGTVSGGTFRNHGWALTPPPNKIPENGSTIHVYIDGVDIGSPAYNFYRSDIASLFPGYANSNGAHAYLDFDTNAYENGVHTIVWTAEDNAGNADGIGSRYFTIRNTVGTTVHRPAGMEQIPIDMSGPVGIIKGYRKNEAPRKMVPGADGIITVEINELERLELHLTPNDIISGYQQLAGQLRSLPIGSTLDTKGGVFYWQPGAGFMGAHQLLFIKKGPNGKKTKKIINVRIAPKFTFDKKGG